jgi:hypothetical protein
MSITTTVENGKIVIPPGIDWPNGTVVRIEPVKEEELAALDETVKDFVGKGPRGITDMAANHNHYLHGFPKA